MRRLGPIVTALAVLLVLAPGIASAARKPPQPPTHHCKVVSTPKTRPGPVTTPPGTPRRDPQPVVVAVPTLRCTGRNPQHPGGSGAVGGDAGGAGNGGGGGAVGNGDGHIPFTGFPMDVSLALSLTLVAAGGLLLVLGLPRRRIA